ncbi:MAG: hypothetical protein AAGG99_04760 [Pseudomonadota bacterium]
MDQDQAHAEEMVARLPARAAADADLVRRARWFTCDWRLVIGDADYFVATEHGMITAFERGPFFMRSASFSLTASAAAWLAFWEPIPRPGAHDILAMSKAGTLTLSGDLTPLMRNLQVVKDFVALPRDQVQGISREELS